MALLGKLITRCSVDSKPTIHFGKAKTNEAVGPIVHRHAALAERIAVASVEQSEARQPHVPAGPRDTREGGLDMDRSLHSQCSYGRAWLDCFAQRQGPNPFGVEEGDATVTSVASNACGDVRHGVKEEGVGGRGMRSDLQLAGQPAMTLLESESAPVQYAPCSSSSSVDAPTRPWKPAPTLCFGRDGTEYISRISKRLFVDTARLQLWAATAPRISTRIMPAGLQGLDLMYCGASIGPYDVFVKLANPPKLASRPGILASEV